MQIAGDSMLIVNWLNGCWKVYSKQYRERVAKLQDELEKLPAAKKVTAANLGENFAMHVYREGNVDADVLTHVARYSGFYSWVDLCKIQNQKNSALRGNFDGGRCEKGAGAGWILWGATSLEEGDFAHLGAFSLLRHTHVESRHSDGNRTYCGWRAYGGDSTSDGRWNTFLE